jgi:hypothetical protein
MPDLRRALADHDLSLLRLIAELWGVELHAANQREGLDEWLNRFADPAWAWAGLAQLPAEAQAALAHLAQARGQIPLSAFMRRYGELRAMGAVKRQREQPWRNQPSLTETLWYRGLIGRGFLDDGRGPEEFIYLPTEIGVALGQPLPAAPLPPPGAPVVAPSVIQTTEYHAAADLVTLLAYAQVATLRLDDTPNGLVFPSQHRAALDRFLYQPSALDAYAALALDLRLATHPPFRLNAPVAQPFLEADPGAQSHRLANAWKASTTWNDLRRLPGLVFEGQAWRNDPPAARTVFLGVLAQVPPHTWWSLNAFLAALKDRAPDFQRSGGDYDAWYIRDAATQAYVRGFEYWDRVDGALARWMLENPLFWWGIVTLGGDAADRAFCLTPRGHAWLTAQPSPPFVAATAAITLTRAGELPVPFATPALDRFRLARFTHWLSRDKNGYIYRLTPAALARAQKKGLSVAKITAFLERVLGEPNLLPEVRGALDRWGQRGPEAAVRDVAVLTVRDARLLATLRQSPVLRGLLGEPLGPNAIAVPRENLPKLREALMVLGILADGA